MKKLFVMLAMVAFSAVSANAFGKSACGDEPVKCYDCAEAKPETIVKLSTCTKKNMPYNYYTFSKVAEKEVASDRYNWEVPAN